MIFDFQTFIEELRQKQDKKQIVEKYEKYLGPITGDIATQERYVQYVGKFEPLIEYRVPEELKNDFDRKLLAQLVLASFSSDYEFKKAPELSQDPNAPNDLYISVKSGDQSVVKTVYELRSFQILRLYEIYIEEQMNLHTLIYENENEKIAINQERDIRLKKRKLYLDTMNNEELKQKIKKEQESQLGSLYEQL